MAIPASDQVGAVMRAADDQFAAFIAVCAFAGLRRGEASALRVSDVDFLRKEIRVARQVQWTADGEMEIPLIRAGCDVVTVQRALGHSSAAIMLTTYSRLRPDANDRTRKAAGDLFAESVGAAADPLRTEDVD
jgi:integrase